MNKSISLGMCWIGRKKFEIKYLRNGKMIQISIKKLKKFNL